MNDLIEIDPAVIEAGTSIYMLVLGLGARSAPSLAVAGGFILFAGLVMGTVMFFSPTARAWVQTIRPSWSVKFLKPRRKIRWN